MGSLEKRSSAMCVGIRAVVLNVTPLAEFSLKSKRFYLKYTLVYQLGYGVTSVSYTHLDVYKRQFIYSSPPTIMVGGMPDQTSTINTCYLKNSV